MSFYVHQPAFAQSNTIDNVVVSNPACSGGDGRLAVTFTLDSSSNRYLSNTLSGISDNVGGNYGVGTHTQNYQYFPPDNTNPGAILTVSVLLGTNSSLGDLDTETFSFNCTTGEKVSGQSAPFATYDSAYTPYATPVTINVALNDIDADGNLNPASATAISGPANGTLTNNGDGSFIYMPNAGFSGLDTFDYQICDTTNLCGTGNVRLEVGPANQPPVANDDFYSTDQDVAIYLLILSNDTDPDSPTPGSFVPTSLNITSNPRNGTLSDAGQGLGTYQYTPNAGFNGTDSFTYQICDNGNLCDSALVTIEVKNTAFAPVAVNDFFSFLENTSVTFNVTDNDTDPNGDLNLASVTLLSNPDYGSLTNNGNGNFIYTPNADFSGNDDFNYQVCDNGNLCASAKVTFEVQRADPPPFANDDSVGLSENTSINFNVTENDSAPQGQLDLASVTVLSGPTNGSLTNNGNGNFSYTPNLNFYGMDSFTYQICNTTHVCASAIVSIEVVRVDNPPIANDDHITTQENTAVTFNVLDNDSDPDGDLDPSTLANFANPSFGDLFRNADYSYTYTPNTGFAGTETIPYHICDTSFLCDDAVITIEVVGTNHPPVANNDTASTNANVPVVINVAANDTDPDGNLNPASVSLIFGSIHATLFNLGDGSFSYTPLDGFTGFDNFTYQICDTAGLCAKASVTIQVLTVNNPPTCSAAYPSIRSIWIPVPIFVPVQILGVTNSNHDRIKITITSITSNEPDRGTGPGDLYPDSTGVGTRSAWIRVERSSNGNGRIYTIQFRAGDQKGGLCTGEVKVTIPLNRGR